MGLLNKPHLWKTDQKLVRKELLALGGAFANDEVDLPYSVHCTAHGCHNRVFLTKKWL